MKRTGWIVAMILATLTVSSCLKTPDYAAEEKQQRDDFLAKNNITTPPTASGLYYVPQDTGTGLQPLVGDTVYINYIASYLDLVIFDTNIEEVAVNNPTTVQPRDVYEPLEFIVGDKTVIDGIDEGVQYMKEGGNALLVIPSELAYHNYQTLLFYVELVDVKPAYDTTAVR